MANEFFMWDLEGETFNIQSVYAVLCMCILICTHVMNRHSEELVNFYQLLSCLYPFSEALLVPNFGAIEFFSIVSDPVTLSYRITWVSGYTSIIYISQSIRQQWGNILYSEEYTLKYGNIVEKVPLSSVERNVIFILLNQFDCFPPPTGLVGKTIFNPLKRSTLL